MENSHSNYSACPRSIVLKSETAPLYKVEEETDSAKQSDTSGVMLNKAVIYFDSSEL